MYRKRRERSDRERYVSPDSHPPQLQGAHADPSHVLDPREKDGYFWALKDINLEIKRGEAVGIIGRNGAGKSTLLKVLSRITQPTEGYAEIRGRVGALLEVGTGMHPELTGRENIYLNGAILGMRREEINKKFDEIVAFAGTEKFLDTPLKRYSSGMRVRLGFSVAAHLEPEILIVDEVLSVGDAEFRKKCLGKMNDVTGQGRTVLFVSHNMAAVKSICQNVALIENGGISGYGPVDEMISRYLSKAAHHSLSREFTADEQISAKGSGVRLKSIRLIPQGRTHDSVVYTDEAIRVEVSIVNETPASNLGVSLVFKDESGVEAFISSSLHNKDMREVELPEGDVTFECTIPANFLNAISYIIDVSLMRSREGIVMRKDDVLCFELVDAGNMRVRRTGRRPGVVAPFLKWNLDI